MPYMVECNLKLCSTVANIGLSQFHSTELTCFVASGLFSSSSKNFGSLSF